MYDTHCHIQFKAYNDDREAMIARCKRDNMILNVIGTQYKTSQAAIALAEQHDWMYATVGLHPIQEYVVNVEEESTKFKAIGEQFDMEAYRELAKHDKVVAIGETGLDRYHVPTDVHTEEVMNTQKDVFLKHYSLSKELNKPLVIHVRDAHDDMIALLKTLEGPIEGTVHCFTGNREQAESYVALGLHLGFTGVITYPPKKSDPAAQEGLLEAVKWIPLNRLLVETDSPFLAPVPYRGKKAEPWMVTHVIDMIAELRGMTREEVLKISTENAKNLFLRQAV